MDDRDPSPPSRGGLLSGRYNDGQSQPLRGDQSPDAPKGAASQASGSRAGSGDSGGLLGRYGRQPQDEAGKADAAKPDAKGQRPANRGGLLGLADSARRVGGNIRNRATGGGTRAPSSADWRATDFSDSQIVDWDKHGELPFEMPPDPDAPMAGARFAPPHDDGRSSRRADPWEDEPHGGRGRREDRDRGSSRGGRGGRNAPRRDRGPADWNDDDWDANAWGADEWDADASESWEAGSWDVSWAQAPAPSSRSARRPYDAGEDALDDSPGMGGGRPSRRRGRGAHGADNSEWAVVGGLRQALDDDVISESLNTLAQLGAVRQRMSRVERVRLLMRRRPAAAALLAFFVLSFMLSCCAPMIPLARLAYDTADLARRVSSLQQLAAGGSASLLNSTKLAQAQTEVAGIESDLYEINGVAAVAGAPFAAVSPAARNYQLLIRMGYDLTGAANESIQVAQKLVTPLEGGALSTSSSSPGITPADIQNARDSLADAYARTLDAQAAYNQLDQAALPSQLRPGTRYGKMLALLPLASQAFGEFKNLIDAAPALLGVGQPAYYLAVAMDRTELRPGGGFQGNYGILELDGGKQSKTRPFGLTNTYLLDTKYAAAAAPNPLSPSCGYNVTMPPATYWWWPVRCVKTYGWGLRDSNLSPDFPTNARTAIQIAEAAGATPNGAPIQGVVAFTPVLIEDILNETGSLTLPDFKDSQGKPLTVTAANLEYEIHVQQLDIPAAQGQDRKAFTHELAAALLARIKNMHGAGLKTIFKIVEETIKSKDLQIYLGDPRAELLLHQLGLDASVSTGGGDGYFVVDTNDGGNKANLYVNETQTDVVTLLPDGSALHRLAINVTYDKENRDIFNPGSTFYDYSDVQRTYLPGNAVLAGYSGFTPAIFGPSDCGQGGYATIITDCSQQHGIFGVYTNSDTPGRQMVMGTLLVMCGSIPQTNYGAYQAAQETSDCQTLGTAHTQTIFVSWYTPHAYTIDASGHGTYTELVEKQAGDQPKLTVYVTQGGVKGAVVPTDMNTFNGLTAGATKVFSGNLTQNQAINYSW